MQVFFEKIREKLIFKIIPDKNDKDRNQKLGEHSQFMYRTLDGSEFPDVHPDRLALVALLNTLPFVSDSLNFGWPVSDRFKQATKIVSRIDFTFIDGKVEPIHRCDTGRHALSFSGGADSTAALAVMPHSSEPVFMLRSKRKSRTLYDSHAAHESCRQLSKLGFNINIIESDFEYLRDPIGFPTDLSVSTPAILIAESRGFESIAFGTILESAYGTSGEKFREYSNSSHYRLWNRMFESVGLGYSLPIAGVSEVGSSLICKIHPIGRFHQSCIRGKWEDPCNKCWKCFRKETLMAALTNTRLSPISVSMIKSSKEVKRRLIDDKPIKHEGVLAFSLNNIQGGGPVVDSLRNLVRAKEIDTDWMRHWYPKSLDLIDHDYRDFTISKLNELIGEMNMDQIDALESWENHNHEEREKRLDSFKSVLSLA